MVTNYATASSSHQLHCYPTTCSAILPRQAALPPLVTVVVARRWLVLGAVGQVVCRHHCEHCRQQDNPDLHPGWKNTAHVRVCGGGAQGEEGGGREAFCLGSYQGSYRNDELVCWWFRYYLYRRKAGAQRGSKNEGSLSSRHNCFLVVTYTSLSFSVMQGDYRLK